MCLALIVCRHFANLHPAAYVAIMHPCSIAFLLIGTAFFFLAEMFYVLPAIFDTGGMMYKLAWLVGLFIVHNILGNQLACYLTDTSVVSLPENRRIPKPGEEHLWNYCDRCKIMVPPRAWHCKWCKCCALRRDHHCTFTATCIGHKNYRYFFWLIFYLGLGTGLSLATHFLAFLINEDFRNRLPVTGILQILKHGSKADNWGKLLWQNCLLILNINAFIFPLLMLAYQLSIFYRNTNFYTGKDLRYNLGLRRNIKLLLGRRGFWTFISPLIRSPLPHDGTLWEKAKPFHIINC